MLSATSTDLASCPRCTGAVRLTLDRFRRDVAGAPFGSFVAHHLKTYDREELESAVEGARRGLPPNLEEQVDRWADQLLEQMEAPEARSVDTATVLDAVVDTGRSVASRREIHVGDAEMLDLFEAVALELVLELAERDPLRRRILRENRGWLTRHRWFLLSAAAGGVLLAWDPAAALEPLGWALLGLGVLPPAAREVRRRSV